MNSAKEDFVLLLAERDIIPGYTCLVAIYITTVYCIFSMIITFLGDLNFFRPLKNIYYFRDQSSLHFYIEDI